MRHSKPFIAIALVVTTLSITSCGKSSKDTSTPPDTSASVTTQSTDQLPPSSVPGSKEMTYLSSTTTDSGESGNQQVVFQFTDGVPGYSASYANGSVKEDGSGNKIEVQGKSITQITFSLASGAKISGDKVENIYSGSKRIASLESPLIKEIVWAGDFEGRLTWAIRTDQKLPYKVTTETNPSRVIVEFLR